MQTGNVLETWDISVKESKSLGSLGNLYCEYSPLDLSWLRAFI